MILEALTLMRDELRRFIDTNKSSTDTIDVKTMVVLNNIAMLETDEQNLKNKIVISLVNLEEENILKNIKSYKNY